MMYHRSVMHLFSRATNFMEFVDFGDFHTKFVSPKISRNSIVTQIAE